MNLKKEEEKMERKLKAKKQKALKKLNLKQNGYFDRSKN